MKTTSEFRGFPKECAEFYANLKQNNTKAWFDGHRDEYEKFVMATARDFVYEMGKLLKKIAPEVVADPRVNKSIFRPFRDTRFSKDKTPYKTHLGIFFWEGERPKMECSGFYFHLEPPVLFFGAGMHCFPKSILTPYRDAVVDPEQGPSLAKAVKAVTRHEGLGIGGKSYKKTPRGYDPSHENAELLLHGGLYAMYETEIPPEFYTAAILEYALERFEKMVPLHRWLVEMTAKA